MDHVLLRCYGDLAELAAADRDGTATVPVGSPRSVKDAIESVGIPHTEVGLVLADGDSVGWEHLLHGGERIAVYPPFGSLPAGAISRVRPPAPARPPTFVADVHLGTLARRLRLLGFDTWYANDADDDRLADVAVTEGRVLLTRDRGLLMRRAIVHGALVRSQDPATQLHEIVHRFGLRPELAPRTRCVACNGQLADAAPHEVADELEPGTLAAGHDRFARCARCGQVYWPGAHDDDLDTIVARIREP